MGACGTKQQQQQQEKYDFRDKEPPTQNPLDASAGLGEETKQQGPSGEKSVLVSKARRKKHRHRAVVGESIEPVANWQKVVVPKDEADRQLIQKSLLEHFLFSSLSQRELKDVVDVMAPQSVQPEEILIKQGDDGDKFYVISEGSFDVSVDGSSVATLQSPTNFGELALMYNEPRNATIRANSVGKVWTLDRVSFKKFLASSAQDETAAIVEFLKSIPFFKEAHFGDADFERTADALSRHKFADGTHIVTQGEDGDIFYLIEEGTVKAVKGGVEVAKMKRGECFGERALLSNEPRAASCVADGVVTVLALMRSEFDLVKAKLGKQMHSLHEERLKMEGDLRMKGGDAAVAAGLVVEYSTDMKLEDLQRIEKIGVGAFGEVQLVKHLPSGAAYAMKKEKKKPGCQADNELEIMKGNKHPFVLGVVAMIQSADMQYIVMEYLQGGDLFGRMLEFDVFNETQSRYYAACVTCAFGHLHDRKILYRDLKPENCVLNAKGVLKVVDFGMSKQSFARAWTVCGTPEYMAPEMISSKGYDQGVDYWALGVLIFEMLCGYTPFADMNPAGQDPNNHIKIYKNVYKYCKKWKAKGKELASSGCQPHELRDVMILPFPSDVQCGRNAKHMIQRLLCPKSATRLGSPLLIAPAGKGKQGGGKNAESIQEHKWFTEACGGSFDWLKLLSGEMTPPIVPDVKDAFDTGYFQQ